MSTNSEDGTLEWPQPLSREERSRIEEETWNWDAVKVYPGGNGPGVPFSTYATDAALPKAAAAPATDTDVPHGGAPSLEGIDKKTG